MNAFAFGSHALAGVPCPYFAARLPQPCAIPFMDSYDAVMQHLEGKAAGLVDPHRAPFAWLAALTVEGMSRWTYGAEKVDAARVLAHLRVAVRLGWLREVDLR